MSFEGSKTQRGNGRTTGVSREEGSFFQYSDSESSGTSGARAKKLLKKYKYKGK